MTQKNFESIGEAATAARAILFARLDKLPEAMREHLEPLAGQGVSPVDFLAAFIEATHAHADAQAVTQDMQRIAAGAARLFEMDGFHNSLNGRATGIARAFDRKVGDTPASKAQAKSSDPEPVEKFLKVEEAPGWRAKNADKLETGEVTA